MRIVTPDQARRIEEAKYLLWQGYWAIMSRGRVNHYWIKDESACGLGTPPNLRYDVTVKRCAKCAEVYESARHNAGLGFHPIRTYEGRRQVWDPQHAKWVDDK